MSQKKIVCNGALCKCQFGDVPDTLTVLTQKKNYINDSAGSQKLIATDKELGTPFQAKTFGQCKMQPTGSSFKPCVPNITKWDGAFEKTQLKENQGYPLLEDSKATCSFGGAPCVEITYHGQAGAASSQNAQNTDEELMSQVLPINVKEISKPSPYDSITVEANGSVKENAAEKMVVEILDNGKPYYKEEITDSSMMTIGDHQWEWDGFDHSGILSTEFLKSTGIEAQVTVWYKGKEELDVISLKKIKHCEVDWVDVDIHRNTKRIEVTLRVNLKERRIDKTVNKTFSELSQLTIDGIKEYWGRNSTRIINGKSINYSGVDYEVFINPINTKKKAMPRLGVVALKNKDGRSRNWWGSRKLFYNEDSAFDIFQKVNKKYGIQPISKAAGLMIDELDFKHTAAHEIGHEILQAFGGKNNYSYIHKGTSTLFTQKTKSKSTLPSSSEFDLMKYFADDYFVDRVGYIDSRGNKVLGNEFFRRSVASEIDVLGLIWLTKMKVR